MANSKWTIDTAHSEVTFKVKHLMSSTVTGKFKTFEGSLESEGEGFEHLKDIVFKADIDSIDTNNEQRDEHLRSSDFFANDEHPKLTFKASKFDVTNDKLEGELTIRDITKPITLDVEFGGVVVDPYGQTKAGLSVDGKISRKEFGLTWNAAVETGGVLVSDDVKIHFELELHKAE